MTEDAVAAEEVAEELAGEEAVNEELQEDAEGIGNDGILFGSTMHGGWKVSYNKVPKPTVKEYMAKVAKLEKGLDLVLHKLPLARDKVPFEVRKLRQDKTRAKMLATRAKMRLCLKQKRALRV